MAVKGIERADVEKLIEPQVANEIFEGTIRDSKLLPLMTKLPNMTSDKTKLRILDTLPIVSFVDETNKNGRKSVTKMAWKDKYINAAELAVIVPIKENLLNDASVDIWAQVRPRITEAFASKIDNAILNGTNKPTDWEQGIAQQIETANAYAEETDNFYKDIDGAMTKVETSGYNVTGILGGLELKSKFRNMLDNTGQPIQNTEIGALPRNYVDNGAWDKKNLDLILGDFKQAVYSIRQDVTFKVLDQAVIQDPDTDAIVYNLAQDDMVALRVTMRLGWALPNPVNIENTTETRFPFASVKKKVD
ncbi:phage major capsid protein [uncultured Rikenella sp.]|uniref:phage major capsid protein n=1 Tax=uncultured Rikenella sp. TaxID=368003 RepID=UPI00262029E0|nr:phage major capsid protein [uncultured Rikenella sp.]